MLRMAGDDTIVVGGGLGGLTAAAFLARSGCPVTVLERAAAPGGRAARGCASPRPSPGSSARAMVAWRVCGCATMSWSLRAP